MGKWETNIGNTVKNNSAGRVIIGGVAKKISVVREVVGGVVKQVWNAYTPKSYDTYVVSKWARSLDMLMNSNEQDTYTISHSDILEAIANGYDKISVTITVKFWADSGQYGPDAAMGVGRVTTDVFSSINGGEDYSSGYYLQGFTLSGDYDYPQGAATDTRSATLNLKKNGVEVQSVFVRVKAGSDGFLNDNSYRSSGLDIRFQAQFTK